MALGRTRMLCGRDPASSDHARIAVFPVQGTQLSVDYVDARFAEALEPSNWVPFLLDVNASDLARRYQIRLVKEDQWYAYLAIRPNVVLDDPWYAYFSFRPNKVLVGDRFDRAGVVLLKESHRPRQIWVHEHGNQTIWNLTKVEGW
jgi:hypothetical protein